MAIARFKDLCLDADDPGRLGVFWAAVLGRSWQAKENGEGLLTGPTPRHTIWVNRVPEAKTVKHRVHLDIYARDVADLEALGASVVEPRPRWTVMADPEGGEFCAFLRPEVPAERLHGLMVDSADPQAQARWWAGVYDVSVPEPKTVKNRIHWDVSAPAVAPLVEAGATVLREPGGDIGWHVLADPEGNEFCAFTQ